MGRQKELIFNTIIIGIGKFSTQIVSVFLLPIYTSILSTEEYGTYDLLYTISMFLIPMITLLMEESMFRFLIDSKNKEENSKIISQTLIFAVISTSIWIAIISVVCKIFKIQYGIIFCFYIISSIIVSLRNEIVRGKGNIKAGIAGLFLSSIISNVIISFIAFKKLRILEGASVRMYDKKLMKEMVKYSIPLVPNSISWSIINFSDRIIVSSVLGTAENGVYSMANKFPTYIDNIYNFFYTAWKEASAKALHYDEPEKFYNQIYNSLRRMLDAIVLGSIAVLPFIFSFFIKKDFSVAYIYVPVLIVATYFSNLSSFIGGIFTAYKDTKIIGKTTIIAATINLVVNLLCIKFIGLWAAAVSTLIAMIINYNLRAKKIRKYIKLVCEYKIILSVLFLVIDLFAFYYNKTAINIINFIIILIYCIYLNQNTIQEIFKEIRKKVSKNK